MKLFIVFAAVSGLSGCVGMQQNQVKDLAAYDFHCDGEKISVLALSGAISMGDPQYGAEGCGKRARYVCNSQFGCRKNSETEITK